MRVARLVLLAIGCLFSQFATSASLYRVTDLGTVSGLAPFSQGFGLNDSGEAVGRTGASITSPFTSQSGSMTALPLPPGGRSSGSAEALDVNNSGVAVGDFTNSTGGVQAAKWQNGVATNLGVTATDQSFAWAINDVGTIVGYGNAQGGGAFMWNPDGSVVKIFNGQAYAINNAGQVAGEVNNQAVLWQNGITWNLGYLPGYTSSHAFGINDAGAVVGWSDFGHPEAFVWINGVMTDLGNLSGGTSGVAWDINDAGQIVGWSFRSGIQNATLWENGTAQSLSSLVDPIDPLFGTVFRGATAINDVGQILVNSSTRAYLLTPEQQRSVPEPASLALLSLGIIGLGFSTRRKQQAA